MAPPQKAKCIRGHWFNEVNTYYYEKLGMKVCRRCRAIRDGNYRKLRNEKNRRAVKDRATKSDLP